MSIRIGVDQESGVRLIEMSGAVTDRELLEAFSTYWASPEYDSTLNEFYDVSKLEETLLTTQALRELAQANLAAHKDVPGVKVAVYSPQDVVFGLLRMYGVFNEESTSTMKIFRDLDAAKKWLGVEWATGRERQGE